MASEKPKLTRCWAIIPNTAALKKGEAQAEPVRFRLRRRESRQSAVQVARARRQVRFRRARDRHLSAGEDLQQALRAAAGRHGRPRPAPHHRLQSGARARSARRSRRQAGRRARLYGDHRRLGARHPARDYGVDSTAGEMGHVRGSASRRISRTRPSSSAPRPARSWRRCCSTASSMPPSSATTCRIRG